MAKMAYVCLYHSYLDNFSGLSDLDLGKLTRAMLRYSVTGQNPRLKGDAKIVWPLIRSQIDRDVEKYQQICEMNRIKGAKGGRASRVAAASRCLAQVTNENENENVNEKEKESEKENEKEKEKEMEREKEIERAMAPRGQSIPKKFLFPSEEEVRKYCILEGIHMDVDRFMDHYTSNGWRVGVNPMQDWQAAVRNWARKEADYGKTETGKAEPIYGIIL